MTAADRRPGLPHRHRAPAQRQRGLALRARADLRRRRRDGRRPGRRGRLQGRGRGLRPRAARRRRRSGSCARRSRRPTARSTSSPAATPRWPGWGRRSPRRSSTREAEEVAIGHVGDSRAYRLRGGKLERLTRDHSLVEEMRRKGQLTDAQAEDHPQRSIITRALGPEPEVEVDLQTVPAAGRRRLPALLRRPDDDARRGADRPPARPRHLDAGGGAGPGRRSQPGRRPRQHHRRSPSGSRTPPRPQRREPRGRDPDRRQRPRRRG